MQSRQITIGRDAGCDICLYDSTSVISRHHATITIRNGRYFITDVSTNGTYVNGIKLVPGREVPVRRNDIVEFAHLCKLDWSAVPKAGVNKAVLISLVAGFVLLGIVAGVLLYNVLSSDKEVSNDSVLMNPPASDIVENVSENVTLPAAGTPEGTPESVEEIASGSAAEKGEDKVLIRSTKEDERRKAEAAKRKRSEEKSKEELNKNKNKVKDKADTTGRTDIVTNPIF